MSYPDKTDQIIAHIELLRSVDRLLTAADTLREKRVALDQLLRDNQPSPTSPVCSRGEGVRNG